MTGDLLLSSVNGGKGCFELSLDQASPKRFSIGQIEAIARGLTVGEYRNGFKFDESVHTIAECTDDGVRVQITVGDETWYNQTVSLADYTHMTRRLCAACNLQTVSAHSSQPM